MGSDNLFNKRREERRPVIIPKPIEASRKKQK